MQGIADLGVSALTGSSAIRNSGSYTTKSTTIHSHGACFMFCLIQAMATAGSDAGVAHTPLYTRFGVKQRRQLEVELSHSDMYFWRSARTLVKNVSSSIPVHRPCFDHSWVQNATFFPPSSGQESQNWFICGSMVEMTDSLNGLPAHDS